MHGYLKIVAISDLHFGSPRIDAAKMFTNLRTHFFPQLKDAHLCVIAGDVYDQLLTVNSKAHYYAVRFIRDILRVSAYTGMQVRILHGTYSHDRDQLEGFSLLAPKDARVKIVSTVSVEEISNLKCGMEELNTTLRVGYLPDNLSVKQSSEVVDQLQNLLTLHGWPYLDMLIGHGTFEHALPTDVGHQPPCTYRISQFDDIVKGVIIMGHIHTSSHKENVYYCGSFERMAHGEEEPKGFYTFTRDQQNEEGWQAKFIKNPDSTLFKTLEPVGPDMPAITNNYISQVKETFPDVANTGGYVRVVHKDPEVRTLLHKVTVQQFPKLIYSSKSIKGENDTEMRVDDITLELFEDVKPNRHNLSDLVCHFLEENDLLGNASQEAIKDKVEELIKQEID